MTLFDALLDAHARVTRAHEYAQDGEIEAALIVLDDLAADLWNAIELEEAA